MSHRLLSLQLSQSVFKTWVLWVAIRYLLPHYFFFFPQRATSDAPPADFQDFLSRIFQVPPGQMSNGNFFAAPQPGPGATAASKPNSTVPKGKAKPKRRKKVRRPFQR